MKTRTAIAIIVTALVGAWLLTGCHCLGSGGSHSHAGHAASDSTNVPPVVSAVYENSGR
jgi:hypothetical protein